MMIFEKKIEGTPDKNELAKMAKHNADYNKKHKKSLPFSVNTDAGNVEYNNSIFNKSFGITQFSPDGSSDISADSVGDVGDAGCCGDGVGESLT